MAFGKTFVLASPAEGVLVDEAGEPLDGVRVTRRWSWGWNSKEGMDEVTTDAFGVFRFGKVTGRSLTAGLMPHEPAVRQTFVAYPDTGAVQILSLQKRNYDHNGELDGTPLTMRCRTDLEPDARGFFWGTCEFDD